MLRRSDASGRSLVYAAALVVPLASFGAVAHAGGLPTGGIPTAGTTINTPSATQMQITSTTARSAISWQDFSIGQSNSVNVTQPSASSTQLESVRGTNVSQIFGSLTSNGSIVIANPNGIWFGPNAQVDVAGLAAVAASPSAADVQTFMNGGRLNLSQAGNANAAIVNQGAITISNAGLAAFVAPGVRNDGVIQAKLGTVQLASGTTATLDFYGDGLISIAVSGQTLVRVIDPSTGKALGAAVTNTGTLNAGGGTVLIAANTAANIVDDTINISGVVQAQGVSMQGGDVVLGGQAGVVAGAGGITLTSAAATATVGAPLTAQTGNISLSGNAVAVNAAVESGGDLTIVAANGNITQSAPITVAGTSTFTTLATNKTITLTDPQNALSGAVTLNTAGTHGNANLTNNATGGTTLARANVGGNLVVNDIAASGGIDFTGAAVTGGTFTATTVNGNIVLTAGAALAADGSGNALVLKAGSNTPAGTTSGGDFVNDGGATALSTPAAGARWLVYTGDANGSGTSVGGLKSYRERYDTASSFVPAAGSNYILYRLAPTLVVTPNAVSTTYDGTSLNKPVYSDDIAHYTISGFVNGDTVDSAGVTLRGSMAFDGSTSTVVRAVGTYTLKQGSLKFSNNDNYAIVFDNPVPNAYVIAQVSLTIDPATPSASGPSSTLQSAGLVNNLMLAWLRYSYTPPVDENMSDLSIGSDATPTAGCNVQADGGCSGGSPGSLWFTADYANAFLARHNLKP